MGWQINLVRATMPDERIHRHFVIYKPFGYLSQFVNNQTRRRNKNLLGALGEFPEGTMAIGRLDEASEGLLLLTTDGQVSEYVRSRKVEKEYYVQVDGIITAEALDQLRHGVIISVNKSKYTTLPCQASILESPPGLPDRSRKVRDDRHGPTSWISMTIREGKFRQVRKMTAAVGYPTLRLVRIRIGNMNISVMMPGDVIRLEKFEI